MKYMAGGSISDLVSLAVYFEFLFVCFCFSSNDSGFVLWRT